MIKNCYAFFKFIMDFYAYRVDFATVTSGLQLAEYSIW